MYVLVLGAICFQLLVWLIPNVIGESVAVALLGLLLGPIYPSATVVFARLLPRSMQNTALACKFFLNLDRRNANLHSHIKRRFEWWRASAFHNRYHCSGLGHLGTASDLYCIVRRHDWHVDGVAQHA